ncbi:MAG: hypothetical protein R3E36_14355 [Nitrosomonas sp.]|nr:hypothetical protein [Nitrosomonas sp.]
MLTMDDKDKGWYAACGNQRHGETSSCWILFRLSHRPASDKRALYNSPAVSVASNAHDAGSGF